MSSPCLNGPALEDGNPMPSNCTNPHRKPLAASQPTSFPHGPCGSSYTMRIENSVRNTREIREKYARNTRETIKKSKSGFPAKVADLHDYGGQMGLVNNAAQLGYYACMHVRHDSSVRACLRHTTFVAPPSNLRPSPPPPNRPTSPNHSTNNHIPPHHLQVIHELK